MRICTVNGERHVFHCWEQYAYTVGESALVGGYAAGQMQYMNAIVEDKRGIIKRCNPTSVVFEAGSSDGQVLPEGFAIRHDGLKYILTKPKTASLEVRWDEPNSKA